MATAHAARRWIRTWAARPHASVRLVCFPWAGGNALAFRPWAVSFPEHVEVSAIEYPGRSAREEESPLDEVGALADAVRSVDAELLDRPYVVLGYSLGALVAHAWLRRVQRENGRLPLRFFVCSRRAPHLPGRHAPLHALPLDDLVFALQQRFAAIPDVLLAEPEILERFIVPLRADLRAVETYRHVPGEPLACPISAFAGARDADVSADDIAGWSEHSSAQHSFRCEILDADHFFLAHPRLRSAVLQSTQETGAPSIAEGAAGAGGSDRNGGSAGGRSKR